MHLCFKWLSKFQKILIEKNSPNILVHISVSWNLNQFSCVRPRFFSISSFSLQRSHNVSHNFAGATQPTTRHQDILWLWVPEWMSRGHLQDIRGASEEAESWLPLNHLWHFPAVWLCWSADRPELLGLPEKSRQLCSPQQGLVKREDLHNAEKAGRSLIPLGMCCSNDRDIMISSTIIIVTHVVSIYVDIALLLQHISSLILQTYSEALFCLWFSFKDEVL